MSAVDFSNLIDTLEAAFACSHDGIHILDKEGRTLFINQACTRIEGITKQEAMEKNIRELVASGVYSESVTLKVLESNKPVTIVQRAKNGRELLATGTPIYKNGEIDKVIVNSRDITELNFLKRELSKKEEITAKYHEELEILRKEKSLREGFIVKSLAMEKAVQLASMMARVDSNLLITGESGVGKGLLSRYIHDNSGRKDGPFIKIDCGTIPEQLFESELFGYEKGAFTGAAKGGKMGLLELANGGTVFLDEIGELPLQLQPKLLRCLNDREIVRVGGKELRTLDIRVIAATNRNLPDMVEEKMFREDLYYRINVVPITIPPLRERAEDIVPLIMEMVKNVNCRYGWSKQISGKTLECMSLYSWPGNVRELENFVERMLVTAENDTIEEDSLPVHMLQDDIKNLSDRFGQEGYRDALSRFDYSLLQKAIAKHGSIVEAARHLRINVTTLRRKLQRYEAMWQDAKML